jgi:hypothetical protein
MTALASRRAVRLPRLSRGVLVPADRYDVQLYRYNVHLKRHDQQTNLDPRDDAVLRGWLEKLVKAEKNTLVLDLSKGWELRVRLPGRPYIVARCRVGDSGLTTVKR